MNRFTLIIHNRGWSVKDACDYWGIRYATYNARCNNSKMFNQLESMCLGLSYNKLECKGVVWKPVETHSIVLPFTGHVSDEDRL